MSSTKCFYFLKNSLLSGEYTDHLGGENATFIFQELYFFLFRIKLFHLFQY